VLVQLKTRKTGFHPVPPTVFRPRPRVDSALVAFVRADGPRLDDVRPVVDGAFAHRRKRLANSLALSGVAGREQAEEALARIGKPKNARAEELAPQEFVALAEALR
jgi:16S rRNA (adenine1518-N6/adenine1519-N6)-dimethyltransferase